MAETRTAQHLARIGVSTDSNSDAHALLHELWILEQHGLVDQLVGNGSPCLDEDPAICLLHNNTVSCMSQTVSIGRSQSDMQLRPSMRAHRGFAPSGTLTQTPAWFRQTAYCPCSTHRAQQLMDHLLNPHPVVPCLKAGHRTRVKASRPWPGESRGALQVQLAIGKLHTQNTRYSHSSAPPRTLPLAGCFSTGRRTAASATSRLPSRRELEWPPTHHPSPCEHTPSSQKLSCPFF